MRVIIDNEIVKEIIELLVKNKPIIEDFTKFSELTGTGDYLITNYGIKNLQGDFYTNSNNSHCYDPTILENLGLPREFCIDRLTIQNMERNILYKDKSRQYLLDYLHETYFQSIKDALKYSESSNYKDCIFISNYILDEQLIKTFENIGFRQFSSFKDYVEQYCNSFRYLESYWINDALENVKVYEFNNPVQVEPTDIFPYLMDEDSILKDADTNKYSRKYDGFKISDIEILAYSISHANENDYNISLGIDGDAHISAGCTIDVGFKFYVAMPDNFKKDDEVDDWDEYLSDLLGDDFDENGYCEKEESIRGEISLLVKDEKIKESNIYNFS